MTVTPERCRSLVRQCGYSLLSVIIVILVTVYGVEVFVTNENVEKGQVTRKKYHATKDSLSSLKDKPLFVMNPGPPHTATPSLLSILAQYCGILADDGYIFDQEKVHRPLTGTYCRKQVACCGDCEMNSLNLTRLESIECMQDLTNALVEYEQKGNLLIVGELIGNVQTEYNGRQRCPTHWNILEYLLRDWRVKILVGYRRYYEWLISLKISADEPFKYRNYNEWPGRGGTEVLAIWDHLTAVLNGSKTFSAPFTTEILRDFRKHFDVSIWNMHGHGDFMTSFLCHELPSARQACQAYASNQTLGPPAISAESTHGTFYDLLAVAAHKAGIVNASLTRPFVVNEVKRRQETDLGLTPRDFPLMCPSRDELERLLLSVSLEYERQLLPEFFETRLGEATHRKDFWKKVDQQEFCTIDVTEVLKDEDWRGFLQSIGSHQIEST